MMKRLRAVAAAGVVAGILLMGAPAAEAGPITGSVSFSGGWSPTGGTGIQDATGVAIVNASVACALFLECVGDYASLSGLIPVTYNNFSFAPLGPPAGGPVNPLWTFDSGGLTYSFALGSVTLGSQADQNLALHGTGILKITGFDDTPATWSFSGGTSGGLVAFSSTATSVPDGGSTMAILGAGLLALGLIRRKLLV